MPTILFYSPFNNRSRDTESLMIAFSKQGHQVLSLTQQEGYYINGFLNDHGVTAYSNVLKGARYGWWYYFRHLLFFIRFCWRHKIDIVYSHLEPANFVASIGQYLIKAKAYLCRHHIDEGRLYHFDKDLSYRITYQLAKHIIVVSDHSKRYMIDHEKIPSTKILHINLAYDFDLYEKQRKSSVQEIRDHYKAEVLLLSACRMTAFKRPEKVIEVAKRLLDRGLDVKLIMLGNGEMKNELEILIKNLHLNDRIFMPGYVTNVLDYMAAANFFLHPSLLDSSCVAIKEAGLVKLPVIVCKGIGDFDDYLIDGKNGFAVNPDAFIDEASKVVEINFQNIELLRCIGESLNKSILDLFSIEHVLVKYDSLNDLPS